MLHTLPASQAATREPIQLGAELYGYAGVEADLEVIRLMAAALKAAGTPASRIDISPVSYTHLDVYKRQVVCIWKQCNRSIPVLAR